MMKHAFYPLKNGLLKVGYQDNDLYLVKHTFYQDEESNTNDLTDCVYLQISEYFEGQRKYFSLPIKLLGTPFQLKVWNALKQIPYGETKSYKDIALMINNPKAYRAVGMANHYNHFWIIIPCHRVINENNKIGGYSEGVEMKKDLLTLESNYK